MKYQNFAVIFVLIMIPMSIMLSYYIQTQTDTITLQTQYQTKLNDSTYDAIAAYQMNSMNTQSVSGESVKSYVLASVNTFFTTLATNLGMSSASKSAVLSYVPTILFTTYDGYYIYSPTKTPTIVTDSNGVAVTTSDGYVVYYKKKDYTELKNDEDITNKSKSEVDATEEYTTIESDALSIEYSYMLKPFIYYSAEYQDSDYDFVASYTLDNYVTLYGTRSESMAGNDSKIEGYTEEFTKSGYLIDTNKIELDGDLLIKTATRETDNDGNEKSTSAMPGTYEEIIASNKDDTSTSQNNVRYVTVNIKDDEAAYNYINYYYFGENDKSYRYNGRTYYPAQLTNETKLRFQTGDEIIESTFEIEEMIKSESLSKNDVEAYLLLDSSYDPITVFYNGIEITDIEAKEYYVKAYFFSKWVQNNLSSVTENTVVQKNIDDNAANEDAYEHFNSYTQIFNIGSDNDPESENSAYYDHKRKVIKNSIQYNLNVAISTYNYNYGIDLSSDVINTYNMPVLNEEDWDSILNNICMVTFMQGISTGTTTFNSYSVVKSNNNNTSVSIENIYFTEEIGETEQKGDYHRYDCPELESTQSVADENTIYEADLSAEFKYDAHKINSKVDDNDNIIAFYDDSTNTYYEVTAERSNWRRNTTE